MLKILLKLESLLIYLFILFIPLIILPLNSEIFEFNKSIFLYITSILLFGIYIFKLSISSSFRKTVVYRTHQYKYFILPVFVYLLSQIVSLYFSIHRTTSLFGYYGRFNGGVLSSVCLTVLFVVIFTWINSDRSRRLINLLLVSTTIVSVIGFLEHFGFGLTCGYAYLFRDKEIDGLTKELVSIFSTDCWFQDVKFRVFSTFGQPNWFATWIVAVIPLVWYKIFESKNYKPLFISSSLLFSVTVFTQSRSGFIAFLLSLTIITIYVFSKAFLNTKKSSKQKLYIKKIILIIATNLIVLSFFGSPWTKSLESNYRENSEVFMSQRVETNLIRKLLWKESISILLKYPIFGSGPETFAYEFTKVRDMKHNETFEWEYLYNKAHNEYLNQFANGGLVGGTSYLLLNMSLIALIFRNKKGRQKNYWDFSSKNILIFLSFFGLVVTNFFGFSVTANSFLFYLVPLLSLNFKNDISIDDDVVTKRYLKVISIIFISSFAFYSIYLVSRYWLADYYYAKSLRSESVNKYEIARNYSLLSIRYNVYEPLYVMQLSQIESRIVENSIGNKNINSKSIADDSLRYATISIKMNPHDVILYKDYASNLIRLNNLSSTYMESASDILFEAVSLSPTDPKLYYNLALTYIRSGKESEGLDALTYSIFLKKDYYDPYFARAYYYYQNNEYDKAKLDLNYILDNISPGDSDAIELLEKMEK